MEEVRIILEAIIVLIIFWTAWTIRSQKHVIDGLKSLVDAQAESMDLKADIVEMKSIKEITALKNTVEELESLKHQKTDLYKDLISVIIELVEKILEIQNKHSESGEYLIKYSRSEIQFTQFANKFVDNYGQCVNILGSTIEFIKELPEKLKN